MNESITEHELPLYQPWERIAAKELSIVLNGVCTGGFDSPEELREKLWDLITFLRPSDD